MSNELPYRVGAAWADITPQMGTQLAGDIGRRRPLEEVRMPLKARAMVIEHAGRRVCVISCDVISVDDELSRALRGEIAALAGCEPGAVLLHCTQSHSSPNVSDNHPELPNPYLTPDLWFVRGGDPGYIPTFRRGLLEAVRQAAGRLTPASLHLGRAADGRVAFNRRFVMRDGSAQCHPPTGSPDILHVEGPTDPEVGVALFKGADGAPLAAILHHTCHPVHGYPQRWAHPDWPGALAEAFAGELGIPGAALTLNGFCGNIHHANHLSLTHVDTIESMTACLLETALRVAGKVQPSASGALDWRAHAVEIPWRRLTKKTLSDAHKLLKARPQPTYFDAERTAITWDWCFASELYDLELRQRTQPYYPYEITALRIGDLALVGWPGEPFVQPQLELKLRAPSAWLFTAHMTNGNAGYQPDAAAIRRGGYETWAGSSVLAPDTGARAAAATLAMLGEMWPAREARTAGADPMRAHHSG